MGKKNRLYNKYDWATASRVFLAKNPVCFWCNDFAKVTDHIHPYKGCHKLFLDPKNWQPLCESCHNRKSRLEQLGLVSPYPENNQILVVGERFAGKTTFIEGRQSRVGEFPFLEKVPGEVQYIEHPGTIGSGFRLAAKMNSRIIVLYCEELLRLKREIYQS